MSVQRRRLAALIPITLAIACAPPSERTDSARTTATPPDASAPVRPWVVTDTGVGPVRAGMTIADAAAALHAPTPPTATLDPECDYVTLGGAPPGLRFMTSRGHIARIDIDSAGFATDLGAAIGDTEARVQSLYGPRVTVQPHKYENGHYLIVRAVAPADSNVRIVFETDSVRVTRFRVGLVPQVEWVEGCA